MAVDVAYMPSIQTKTNWAHPWAVEDGLRLAGPIEMAIGSSARDRVEFVHHYGPLVKHVEDAELAESEPLDILDKWIRVVDTRAPQRVIWQGMVKEDRRKVHRGTSPRGIQKLLAIGGAEILSRITVDASYWWNTGTLSFDKMGWVPHINERGAGGRLQGTRGAEIAGQPYGYGTAGVWTFRQFLDYLLRLHIAQAYGGVGSPTWRLTGETTVLDNRLEPVRLQPSQSCLDIVRRLIRLSDGIEFAVIPSDDGFDLNVFSVSPTAVTFGEATLPANTNVFVTNPTTDPFVVDCEVAVSHMQRYDSVEAIGERIESCFTVLGTGDEKKKNLWSAAQETTYKDGSSKGVPTTADHDLARSNDQLRLVYTGFAAPDAFDLNLGEAAPVLDDEGEFTGIGAVRQVLIRSSMPATPLREGGDYSTNPPTLTDAAEDFVPAMAVGKVSVARGYVILDKASLADLDADDSLKLLGASVSVLENDWGVIITFDKNHIHAKNHWNAGAPADSAIDPETEGIDYDDTEFTISAPMDQRLACRKDNASPARDGSKAVIEAPGTRFQYLSASTTIGVQDDGTRDFSPEPSTGVGIVLRNDNEALHWLMVGAIARFLEERFSFAVTWFFPVPEPAHLGQIMQMGPGEGDLAGKQGLITAVGWDFERSLSWMRVGYA